MGKPVNFGGFILYRIFYGEHLVYLGRTKQPLQSRIRGHLFKKPMQRELHIEQISRIDFPTFASEADMNLYEIYYINKWKPPLNRDDKAPDELSVDLPEVEWRLFETPLWEKWRAEIIAAGAIHEEKKRRKLAFFEQDREMRRKRRNDEITEEEYWRFWEEAHQNI